MLLEYLGLPASCDLVADHTIDEFRCRGEDLYKVGLHAWIAIAP